MEGQGLESPISWPAAWPGPPGRPRTGTGREYPHPLRLRPSGSAGSHNGIEHIIVQSATEDIPRLRIGFDRGFPVTNMSHAVLSIIPRGEMALVKEVIENAADALLFQTQHGMLESMTRRDNSRLYGANKCMIDYINRRRE